MLKTSHLSSAVDSKGNSYPRFIRPEALQRACGIATGAMRGLHSLPTLSLSALLATAMFGSVGYAQDAGSESSSESGAEGSGCENGDCESEEDTDSSSESVDSNDGEVCQDESECPCDNGGGQSGADSGVGGPKSLDPVAWDTGEKWEQTSDLYVKVKGKDFQLTRQYSSHPDLLGDLYDGLIPPNQYGKSVVSLPANPSVGIGWAFSNLRGLTYIEDWLCEGNGQECVHYDEGPPPTSAAFPEEVVNFKEGRGWLSRPGRKPRSFTVPALTGVDSSTASGSSVSDAPGNQGIIVNATSRPTRGECGSPCQGEPVPVPTGIVSGTITFQEPGRWRQDFSITSGSGWISKEVDEYGNTRDYEDIAGVGIAGMPDTIYLNGEYNSGTDTWENYEARIELYWENFDFDPGVGTDNEPLLVRAEVWRPTSLGDVNTQFVEYYHLDASGSTDGVIKYLDKTPGVGGNGTYIALDVPGTTTDLEAAADLGTHGDLVQVVKFVAIDPEDSGTDWRTQVTQYRYHDSSLDAPTTGDIRLRIEGEDHQIKMVFKPQQLEYIAQQRLGSGTPDDMTAIEEAYKLLAIEDDGVVDSTNGVDMYEVAAKIVSYDRSFLNADLEYTYPVEQQFLQATSCGCGGGATSAVLRTYEQIDGWQTSIGGTTVNGESIHMDEYKVTSFTSDPSSLDDNIYRTLAYDMIFLGPDEDKPYLWMKAVIEGDEAITERGGTPGGTDPEDDPRSWVTRKVYDLDDRAVTGKQFPSMFSAYTPAATGVPNTEPSATLVSDGGYGEVYGYDATSNNENVGVVRVQTRTSGSFAEVKIAETEYTIGAEYLKFLPTSKTSHRGGTGAANEETISYGYGFESDNSAKLNWRKITIERELSAENGDSSATSADYYEFFDDCGKLIWEVDPDSTLTRYEYDFITGVLVKVVRNSEHPDNLTLPSDPQDPLYATLDELDLADAVTTIAAPFPTSGSISGEPLTTEYAVDLLGRTTKITQPGGVKSYIAREMREDSQRPGILYYAKVVLPHELSTGVYNGPARVRYMDADGKTTHAATFELNSFNTGTLAYTLGTELSRSASEQSLSGSVTKSKSWWELGESHATVHETTIEYDQHGRTIKVTDAEGTVTQNVYDAFDRMIETKVGTTSSAPITVAEYFYDGNPTAVTPDHGVGNGNVTAVALYDGESSDARITRMYYDGRDRLIGTMAPDTAMSVTKYDNLDRVIEEAAYAEPSSAPSQSDMATLASSVPNTDTTYGDRAWHAVTDYSQRGLVWRQRVAIDPASSSTSNYLDWLMWYDAEGNEIASWGPNSPMTVYEYDEHDRVSKMYVSDRFYEIDQSDFSFTNATSVSGDTVLEQAEYTYDDDAGGVLELIKTKMRVHDATATGALADNDSITSYLGLIYDNALRQVATVNFGTNKSTFSDGTSTAPTLSSYDTLPELRSATDVLFSWQEYNTRGMVDEVVAIQSGIAAADEIRSKYLYDDLYRSFAVIENYDDATLAWNTTEGRYVASGLDHTDLSEDRITSFVHDKVNKVTKRVAHIAAESGGSTVEDAQITQYEYGVAAGSPGNVMDSLVASNNLLSRVRYPDESTGEPGATSKYYVDYAFNRLGELRGVIDQNQTTRIFDRDEQGRVLADIVHNITTHTGTNARNIDDDIERIGYRYDGLGRMTNATSHTTTAASGNIRDEIEITYTPLWQVEKIYQQHDGVVDTGTSPAVEYLYSNMPASGAEDNYSRLINVNYPTDVEITRDTLQYVYGTDDINDRISRVSKLQVLGLNGTTSGGGAAYADLIGYERIGLGMTAKATIGVGAAGWDAVLDRTVNHDGSSTSGAYPAFDKFGRIVSHMWVRDDFGPHGTVGSLSNQPAYLEVTHTYDRSSNRLTYNDNRQGAKLPDRNRTFQYDRLNRLTQEIRTPIPSGSTYTSQHASLRWNLDTLGNWDSVDTDSDHDGDFDDGTNLDRELVRQHTMANEIESGLQYDSRIYESAVHTTYKDRLYDDNGNMTDERAGPALPAPGEEFPGQRHTYDAWNRLVKSEYINGSGTSTAVISVNTYNALGWRTSKAFDDAQGAYSGLVQKRVYSYGADWRMLEERIDTDVSTNSDSAGGDDDDTDWIGQQFWGIRYIDDAVGKRIDRDGDADFVDEECTYWYQLTDTQFSVCVVLDGTGNVYERIEYDAYGQANHRYAGDADGDNTVTNADMNLHGGDLTIDLSGYHADLDVNCDGTINSIDVGIVFGHTPFSPFGFQGLPSGWIGDPSSASGPDNSIGYAGYVFNHEREDYTVRFRNYNPELGRWMQRDPIGYLGGENLYGYIAGRVMMSTDPFGLCPECDSYQGDYAKDQQKKKCKALETQIGRLAKRIMGRVQMQRFYEEVANGNIAVSNVPGGVVAVGASFGAFANTASWDNLINALGIGTGYDNMLSNLWTILKSILDLGSSDSAYEIGGNASELALNLTVATWLAGAITVTSGTSAMLALAAPVAVGAAIWAWKTGMGALMMAHANNKPQRWGKKMARRTAKALEADRNRLARALELYNKHGCPCLRSE